MDKLLDYFSPTNYQLNLEINRQSEEINGKVLISGVPTSETAKFHAVGLEIKSARLSGEVEDVFSYHDDIIELPVDVDLIGQVVTFEITYHTKLNKNMQGCYLSTYQYKGREERIATTQFESHYARECFPCIDEPAAKATFELILTIPDLEDGDIVLANTPLIKQEDKTFIFETTPRMSTYLLAWTIGKFHKVETTNKNGVKVASYATLSQPKSALEFANETAARALEYYDAKFVEKYPLKKLDQVALPDFEAGAMENWGLVTYRESMMLADENAMIETRQQVALTVTHELSHQWFGDLVTMNWWDDLWLNESFASIMEFYCTDALYPEFEIWQNFYTSDCRLALQRDALEGVQAVQQAVHDPAEIATLFDSAIVYAKGARLILMLIHLLGEEKFDQGVRDYFDKYKYQNTIGDDFWQALQPYADFDVKEFMHAWISQPGYPEIRDGEQHRFLLDGKTDGTKWPLPEIFDDMSGHYLLNLTNREFSEKLAIFTDLSSEQKLRLLIDRELLARTPAVPSASLLDLLQKFVDEKSAAVWDILQTIIADLKLFCPPETEIRQKYQKFLTQTFGKHFSEINYGKLVDLNTVKVRDALVWLALYCEDAKVTDNLRNLYNDDLAKIDSELRSAVLIATLRSDESKYFADFLQKYQQTQDPELKADLIYIIATGAKAEDNIQTLIGLLERPEIVRPQDHLFLFIYLLRNHYTHRQAFEWLLQNWDYVQKLTGEKSIEDYPRYVASTIRERTEAEQFYQFFDPMKDQPALRRTLEMAQVEIEARLALIEVDYAGVEQKLAQEIS